jgi:quinolinate synthase
MMNLNVSTPPAATQQLSMPELELRIEAAQRELGKRLVILGHHYMTDEVLRHADYRGDSFALAKIAAQSTAEFIVFCGVHFMAETADILTSPEQKVFIPDVTAGCSLAEFAASEQVATAWQAIHRLDSSKVIPIAYVNSEVSLKAFCGRNDGLICTSSNAQAAIQWAFERGDKVFFFPDQHLGRNTAFKMGIPLEKIVVWEQARLLAGDPDFIELVRQARIVLWHGYCSVHQEFDAADARKLCRRNPNLKLLIHPECNFELAQIADYMGSTAYIIKMVESSPAGSRWAIATEKNLVNRLIKQHPDQQIEILPSHEPYCNTMAKVNPLNLCYQLEQLVAGNFINQVLVEEQYRANALLAVERMMSLKP